MAKAKQNKAATDGDGGLVRLSQPAALAGDGFEVDAESGLFKNVSIITRGPAIGHGFDVDDKMLEQVAASLNGKAKGVKAHMTHAGMGIFSDADSIEFLVGRAAIGEARIVDGQVRADIQLREYARKTPRGDLWAFLTGVGKDDPDAMGVSIVFVPDQYEEREDENQQTLPPAGRVKDVTAVDFVGDAGANPGGLLERKQKQADGHGRPSPHGDGTMNEALKKYLASIGLDAEATDEEAAEYAAALEGDQKTIAEGLADKPKADEAKAEKTKATAKPKADDDGEKLSAADKKIVATRAADRARFGELKGLAAKFGKDIEWLGEQFESGATVEQVRTEILKEQAAKMQRISAVSVGADREAEGLSEAISDAICLRTRIGLYEYDPVTRLAIRDGEGRPKIRQAHKRAEQFRALPLSEMARQYLVLLGMPGVNSFTRPRIADLVMSRDRLWREFPGVIGLAQSTSSFPYILEDVQNKSLQAAYAEATKKWEQCFRRTTNPDFKTIKRMALSAAPDLVEREEGAEVKYYTLTEKRETYHLVTYSAGITQTRLVIINDDIDAFNRIPALQANSCMRKEDTVAFAPLTANAAMGEDSKALFHADHSNYVASGSGAAPSVATLNAARTAMRTQKDIKGEALLDITPVFLIAPAALEGTVRSLLESETVPGTNQGHSKNIWKGELTPIIQPRLDATSITGWYLAALYNQIDTIEVCFLEGEEVPQLKTETVFDTGDVKYAVTHTVAAKPIDFRGLYFNYGV